MYEAETKPTAVFSDCGVAQVFTVADEAVARVQGVLGLLNEVALNEAESWELLSRWAGRGPRRARRRNKPLTHSLDRANRKKGQKRALV